MECSELPAEAGLSRGRPSPTCWGGGAVTESIPRLLQFLGPLAETGELCAGCSAWDATAWDCHAMVTADMFKSPSPSSPSSDTNSTANKGAI